MSLASRLSRLEATRDQHAVFVVSGLSSADHDAQIAGLIAAGSATSNSLFVCIRKSGDRHGLSAQAT